MKAESVRTGHFGEVQTGVKPEAQKKGQRQNRQPFQILVGARGFEPPTSWSQTNEFRSAMLATRRLLPGMCRSVTSAGDSCKKLY